jgi:rhodanese-related sulfurtransferase
MNTASTADLVALARQEIDNLSPGEFDDRTSPETLVVDLREPEEVAAGAIVGAVHVPRGMLEFRADPASPYHLDEFNPDRPVLLYCASGGRSALAGAVLRQLGYRSVAHLDGGLKAWTDSGRAIV